MRSDQPSDCWVSPEARYLKVIASLTFAGIGSRNFVVCLDTLRELIFAISRILDNYIGQKQRITPGDDRRNIKSRKLIPLRYVRAH